MGLQFILNRLQVILDRLQVQRDKIKNNREGAFSLVEFLMVIVIIGVLSAIAIGAFHKQKEKQKEFDLSSNAETVQTPPPPEPMDTSWILPTLGVMGVIVAGIIGLGVLFFIINKIVKNALRNAEEAKRIQSTWNQAFSQHDSVINDWLDWTKNDIGLILDFPVLQDAKNEHTRDVVVALDKARALRPETKVKHVAPEAYALSVQELSTTWEQAKTYARKIKQSCLTPQQLKDVRLAQDLIATIEHDNTPRAEKILAAKKVQKLLDGFIELGDKPMLALEAVTQLSLADVSSPTVVRFSTTASHAEPLHVTARKNVPQRL